MNYSTFFKQTGKKFFFNDIQVITKYALEHFPDECNATIETANDIVSQRFKFDLRWDLERSLEYVEFQDDIDWLYQPGNDPEWVYAFNRMSFWICLGQAYAMTNDEKYANAFVKQLCHWIKTVPQTSEKAWRSIEVGLRLEYWLKAVRYFESSPAMTDEITELFCNSIIEQAEFLMRIWNPYNLISNWGILGNRGLFMAGVMLPKSERTDEYVAQAAKRLSLEMQMQVYRDGVHWEQSPMYHNEVLKCYLDILTLALRNNIALPDNIERQARDMCYVDLYSAKPDHHEVGMGDSDNVDQRDILARAAMLFNDSVLKSRAYSKPDFDSLWEIGEAGIESYSELAVFQPEQTDKAFCDSNNYYFRSGWGDAATYLHFHCGTLGAGHGHADKLHIDLFSRGEDILVDAGRYTYVFCEDRVRCKETRAHNVLMADGEDFYICKDSWECSRLTRGINQKYFSNSRYGYTEGGHLAYYDRGIYINRRVFYLKPDIIVLADELYATGEHIYNQFFHFNNTGIVEGNGCRYFYKGARVTAEIVFLAQGISCEIGESGISRHYNQKEKNSMITTTFNGNGFTSAFTILALCDVDSETNLRVDKLQVKSTFRDIIFNDNQIEAIGISFGDMRYTVAVAHEEFASPTDTFNTDGCIGFGNCVVFDRAAGETEIGTVLLW